MKLEQRHKSNLDRPVSVQVQCHIQSLSNVDTTRQTFEASFIIVATLHDVGQLNPDGTVLRDGPFICEADGGGEIDQSNWDPRLYLENLAEMKSEWHSSARRKTQVVEEDGTEVTLVHWSYKYRGIAAFADQLQLLRFPFDWQRLSIRVTSARPYQVHDSESDMPSGVVRLVPPQEFSAGVLNVSAFPLANVFIVKNPQILATPTTTSPLLSPSGKVRPKIKFSIVLRRQANYYITTAIFPMVAITLVGLSSFAIPIHNNGEEYSIGDKLSVSATAMLGGVVFRLAALSDLPRLGYLTYLDWYLLSCEITQYLAVAQNVVGYKYYVDDDADNTADAISQTIVFIFFACVQMFCLIGYIYMRIIDNGTSPESYVQLEKKSRLKLERRLFDTNRKNIQILDKAGISQSFQPEQVEGAHTFAGYGAPLTTMHGKQLFSPWHKFDANAAVEVIPIPRESKYPTGKPPVQRLGSASSTVFSEPTPEKSPNGAIIKNPSFTPNNDGVAAIS